MEIRRADRYLILTGWKYLYTEPAQALIYCLAAQEIGKREKDTLLVANGIAMEGTVYQVVGDFPKSIKTLIDAVELYEKMKDSMRIAIALNNLGNTYRTIKEYSNATNCHLRALEIRIRIKDSLHLRSSYINLAAVASEQGDIIKAKGLMLVSASYKSKSVDDDVAAFLNLSGYMVKLKEADSALYYLKKAQSLVPQEEYAFQFYDAYGAYYTLIHDYKKAEENYLKALKINEEMGEVPKIQNSHEELYALYRDLGAFEKSLYHYEISESLKDSLSNQQKDLQVAFMNAAFQTNQKQTEIEQLKNKSLSESKEKQKIILVRNMVIGGLLLLSIIAFLSIRQSRERKKLMTQLGIKNSEITDSINYAKSIQEAYLPKEQVLNELFSDAFVLFKPKDIVSGDFYWFHKNEEKDNDEIFIAVADCTGHGVPGSIMSIICCNALNEVVVNRKISDPSEILDRVRTIIIDGLKNAADRNQNDGMDIAFCRLNKKTGQLSFSGANNPLWIVDSSTKEISIIKGDKQPVGRFAVNRPFTNHTVQLKKGEAVYLFSDGYADQFGGGQKKKFKRARLQQLIQSNAHLPMKDQRNILNAEFEKWRGTLEQIDDVCIVGLRF